MKTNPLRLPVTAIILVVVIGVSTGLLGESQARANQGPSPVSHEQEGVLGK